MINQSEFYNNKALLNGGGAYVGPPPMPVNSDTAFIRFENVLWHDNLAGLNPTGTGYYGGGLAGITMLGSGDVIDIVNNTFTLNKPDGYGNNSSDKVRILNTILWNNGPNSITGSNIPTVANSLIQGAFPGSPGVNNKTIDPLFINPLSNFRLSVTSPALNMGDNSFILDTTDLDGLKRIVFNTVDMGAYENLLKCETDTLYVNADGSVPSLPVDSILGVPIGPTYQLVVNGMAVTTAVPFNCSQVGSNNLNILLIKPNCMVPDTLYRCTKIVVIIDSFPKSITAYDQLNISLDEMCMRTLTTYELLANFKGCSNDFEVHLAYPNGTNHNVPDNKLDRSHVGYCMVFSVTQKNTGNKTWGKLCVEDKLPPQIGCGTSDTLTCAEISNLPANGYTVSDNCGGPVKVTVASESFVDFGCESPNVQGVVTRHLIASDPWGNTSECDKKYYILKFSADSIVCARDTAVACKDEYVKDSKGNLVSIKDDPKRSGVPMVKTARGLRPLWPNTLGCKLEVYYKDERFPTCGTSYKILRQWYFNDWCTGKETSCRQWIEVIDTIRPLPTDTTLADISSSPHDCGQYVDLPLLAYKDCSNKVTQTFILQYSEEGTLRNIHGTLPATHIWLPAGSHTIEVTLIDDCNNRSTGYIYLHIIDNTPPTPVCDEYTQVTVDPTSCWSAVAAADLDNGSHDNCCSVLHFAAAKMDSIVYWRNYWNTRLETEVGKAEFWKDKAIYDELVESWINCYVFSDTVHFDECGTNQVVLRVYEACGIPILDPHIWPCSPHAWFCYNTYLYIGDFNYNWFDPKGAHSCAYRPDLASIAKLDAKYSVYEEKGYLQPKFAGAAQFYYCDVPFYFPTLQLCMLKNKSIYGDPNGGYCSARLYNDCMVNVLVDDKQAPAADHLEDVTVYCDGVPGWLGAHPYCDSTGGENYQGTFPGAISAHGVIYGYYGGSAKYDLHMGSGDHNDPQACSENKGWAPIYCRPWLYIDSFDQGGKVNPYALFKVPVLIDKKHPLDHDLRFNEFTITDNCRLASSTLRWSDQGTINGCGEGWIQRTWTIRDTCGNPLTVSQKIIVRHRSDFEVIFPEDKTVTCDFLNRTDTSTRGAGKPSISDDDCEQIGVTYKDEIFTIVDSACYKIVRTWTLIDWCIFDPNQHTHRPDVIVNDSLRANNTNRSCVYRNLKDNNDGYMQYVQIIKVIDEVKPHITSCSDQTVCIDKDCSTTVNIPLSGTDNCSDQIRFRVDITRPDGMHDKRSDITAITGSNFTAGAYKIQVIAKDQCGNEDTCSMTLTIKDCKKPTPYCFNGIATVVMPSTGKVTVWAKDLDKGSTDNCAGSLVYSFSKDTTNLSRLFTCADIPNGQAQQIPVQMWVTDAAGNQDFCSTYILLEDNGGACPDTATAMAHLSGKLLTEEQEGVEYAAVEVKGMQDVPKFETNTDGSYSFNNIPMNIPAEKVSIRALRDDNPMNGVSTLDLVLIQKHIMGTEPLKSAYKVIAADVDNNSDITVMDLVELRKLILGLYDKLPNNTSWKFIPRSYHFNDALNPWNYPAEDVLHEMKEQMVSDFVGVKIGDVNGSAAAHSLMGTEVRGNGTGLIFEVEDNVFKAGDKVSVEFRSPNFKGVSGFQGTMNFTIDKLQFYNLNRQSSIVQSSINFTENNVGRRWEHEGMITMSWNTNTSMDLKDDAVLFTMHFTAQSAGRLSDVLRIGSQHTIAESYEGKGELGNLSIRFVGKDGREVTGKSELYQNYPNPFDQRTVIGINLAESGKGTLKITDITGRILKSISKDWTKGYNEIWLKRNEFQPTGILFYSFESKEFTATKRMIMID